MRERIIARLGDDRAFVVFDEPLEGRPIMSIRATDREGGRQLAEHLIERGHERIAFIAAAEPWAVVEQRARLPRGACRPRFEPDPALVRLEAGWEPASAYRSPRACWTRPRADAIICATDLLALATIHTARSLGIEVPEDVAISGSTTSRSRSFAHRR